MRNMATVIAIIMYALLATVPATAQPSGKIHNHADSGGTVQVPVPVGYEGQLKLWNHGRDVARQASWRSNRPGIVSVDQNGRIRAVAVGSANIFATYNDASSRPPLVIQVVRAAGPTPTPDPAPSGNFDYRIENIRRTSEFTNDVADWLRFRVIPNITANRIDLRVRFHQGSFFTDCSERVYNVVPGRVENELSIPDICGADVQWSAVTISAADSYRCQGCGRFNRTSLPLSRSMQSNIAEDVKMQQWLEHEGYLDATGSR